MGVRTDGIVGFGVLCEEGIVLPWNEIEDFDIERWWLDVSGYVSEFQPFTKEGGYAEGWDRKDERFHKYYSDRAAWLKENPAPVEVVNYCSQSAPMYALCATGTVIRCRRGYPTTIKLENLTHTKEQLAGLLAFLDQWEIVTGDEPQWLLMSYWG